MKMNIEQKELLNNILANKEFLAELLKAATENKPMEIPKLQIGDSIDIAGITWRKFKEDENGSYMLADDIVKESKFGNTNNWKDSIIRKDLVGLADEIVGEIGNKIVPITIDLFSHDGLDDYGTCEDYVSILTYDLYRNNRKNIKKINKKFFLATPNSTPTGCGSDYVQCVNSYGSVYYYWCNYCFGVRPFFILQS